MNDRFKYRVWDKLLNKMVYLSGFSEHDGVFTLYVGDGGFFTRTDNQIELEQCTGLKDKYNTLIFEGDVLEDRDGNKYVVSWHDKMATFCISRKEWRHIHYFYEGIDPVNVKRVGSIHQHQHKHLLE